MAYKFQKGEGDAQEQGENGNDYIIRRTREFNTLTRERPDDENSWLEFAKFQVATLFPLIAFEMDSLIMMPYPTALKTTIAFLLGRMN